MRNMMQGKHSKLSRGLRPLYLVSCVLYLALLSACGFHLRGAYVLPEVMEATLLKGVSVNSPLGIEIGYAIEGAGGRLVENLDEASAVLAISGEKSGRRVLTTDSGGTASEYELLYQFSFELRTPGGDLLLAPQQVSMTRSYSYDPNNVLGKGEEEQLIYREMRGFAVRQMMQRLRAATRGRSAGAAPAATTSPVPAQ